MINHAYYIARDYSYLYDIHDHSIEQLKEIKDLWILRMNILTLLCLIILLKKILISLSRSLVVSTRL